MTHSSRSVWKAIARKRANNEGTLPDFAPNRGIRRAQARNLRRGAKK